MAKSNIVKVKPSDAALAALPAFLKDAPVEGVDELKGLVRPPFLKIVQKQAHDETLERFDVGDLIQVPSQTMVAAYRGGDPEVVRFTPLFFYVEYCAWSPIETRGQVPMILERTVEPTSMVARMSQDPNTRSGGTYQMRDGTAVQDVRYSQHLNFVVALHDHPLGADPMLMSFSRGEFKTGVNLASKVKMRRASIYDCVFEAHVCLEPRKQQQFSWLGLDISNPALPASPWVTEEQHDVFKELHAQMADHFKQGRLKAEYEPSVASVAGGDEGVEVPASRDF